MITLNETEFITEILEEMETWIFQNLGHRSVKDRSKYRGTKIWNGLDTELKSISDLNYSYRKAMSFFLTHKL